MKKILFATLISLSLSSHVFGINAANWHYRQAFEAPQAGPSRISVPVETLDVARADLRDLRIVDGEGNELPYAVLALPTERAAYRVEETFTPRGFQTAMQGARMVIDIDTGASKLLDSVRLDIPDKNDYMKPARIEVSADRENWILVGDGIPLFRRSQGSRYDDVVQNTLPLNAHNERYVRITIFDQGSSPVAVSGATLNSIGQVAARSGEADEEVQARIMREEENRGETLLTIDLGAGNLSLTQLRFDIADGLFARTVTVMLPEGGMPENTPPVVLAKAEPIYNMSDLGGARTNANSIVRLDGTPVMTRTIIARIANGDSPPLRVRGVSAMRKPVHIAFNPPSAGSYVLLSGNAQAAAPRYDLAAFAGKFAQLDRTQITARPITETSNYVAPALSPTEPQQYAKRAAFWVGLAIAAAVLLFVIAKLLPKSET